jgi:integrase
MAVRPTEALDMVWPEVDLDGRRSDDGPPLLTIPKERMKKDRAHEVPLTARVVEILRDMKAQDRTSQVVFHSQAAGCTYLGDRSQERTTQKVAALAIEQGLQINPRITPHGFRSAFKRWASRKTSFPRELIEDALAHRLGDDTEDAYARSDEGSNYAERRRALMSAWADFCAGKTAANVVTMKRQRAA